MLVAVPAIILSHVCSFFSSLLAATPTTGFKISPDLWLPGNRMSAEDNAALMIPLSSPEIDEVAASSNSNSAPGPDGFSVAFFKKF